MINDQKRLCFARVVKDFQAEGPSNGRDPCFCHWFTQLIDGISHESKTYQFTRATTTTTTICRTFQIGDQMNLEGIQLFLMTGTLKWLPFNVGHLQWWKYCHQFLMEEAYKDIEHAGDFSGSYGWCLLAPPRNPLMMLKTRRTTPKNTSTQKPRPFLTKTLLHPRGVSSTLFTSLSAHSVHCVRKSMSVQVLDDIPAFLFYSPYRIPSKIYVFYKSTSWFFLWTSSSSTSKVPISAGKIHHLL